MKKLIGKISAIILIFQIILQISVPMVSEAITGTSDSRFEYTINSDGTSITITKYVGTDTEIVIPSTIDGYSVTRIGESAFRNCSSLININIPEGVTSIGQHAFESCSNLTSIEIPSSVKYIGYNAFSYCKSLKSISIPEGVTSIESDVFYSCSSLTSISIPSSIISIGSSAFSNCNSLVSIEIPSSVTTIGDSAFYWCINLTSINIPEGVTNIGYGTFSSCFNLTSISIPNTVTSIGNYAFHRCGSLTNITIPEEVTSIESYAFRNCENLTIKCKSNSTAHQYAVENNIPYELYEKAEISSTKYTIDENNKYIVGIKVGTTKEEIRANITTNIEYKIVTKDGKEVTTEKIATGMKIEFATGESYEIVVKGDVNGDGKISTTDITKLKKHIIQKELLQGYYEKAGNINDDTKISVTDLANMKKAIVGLIKL